jgi:trehalose-phosphatase
MVKLMANMSRQELITRLKEDSKQHWFLVFDRDGTLVPHAASAQDAILDLGLHDILINLAGIDRTLVAILSARSCQALQSDFQNETIIFAGNYGMEILMPDKKPFLHPVAHANQLRIREVKETLENLLPKELNVVIDDHGYSLCLHWHLVEQESQAYVHKKISEAQGKFPDLFFRKLASSYEFLPAVEWDKGKALEKMVLTIDQDLTDQEFSKNCLLLYMGDSQADEPAFDVANQYKGISIKIGSDRESQAQYVFDNTNQARDFIEQLLVLRRGQLTH